MRVALLTQYYKPEMGAPQNRLYEMVMGLRQLGNEVVVVTAMPNYPTGKIFAEYKGKFSATEQTDDITIRRYWLYASNSKKSLPRILSMLSFSATSLCSLRFLLKHKPDCIVVESPPLTLCLTAMLLAKLCRAKLVTNISDLWPLSAKELGALSEQSCMYKLLERLESFIYRHSAACMGQSEEIVNYIRKIKEKGGEKNESTTYLFRNGVDPKRFEIQRFHARERSEVARMGNVQLSMVNVQCPTVNVIYTGLLGFAQGLLQLCESIDFSQLGAEFHIYGDGGEKEAIAQYVAAHPERGIIYHGSVSRDEIPQVLSQADVTLIPLIKHIYGAVPSKIYESMAAGLPIIFAGEGEGQHIVEKYQLGWTVPARDYNRMKKCIAEIAANPAALQTFRNNCIHCAQNYFNRPKQISDLNQFLQSLITN